MDISIGKAINLIANLAIPVAGGVVGFQVSQIQNGETAVPVVIGTALFGLISGFAPGERSHRYVGGIVAQAVPLFLGLTLADSPYQKFELAPFFTAVAISISAQIFLRELRHLPEAWQRGGKNEFPQASPAIVDTTSSEDRGGSSTSKESSDIIPYGVSNSGASGTLSTFVPKMKGLQVADPGSVIIGVEEEEHIRKHLIEGNTTFRRKKYKTAEGGSLEENSYEYSGWFGSESRNRREYTAGSGTYGSAASSSKEEGPVIEEID